jgi:hypothetical protein
MDDIEKHIEALQAVILKMLAEQIELSARISALQEVFITSLSSLHSFDRDKLRRLLEDQKKICHQAELEAVEDSDPFSASRLDNRDDKDLPQEDQAS